MYVLRARLFATDRRKQPHVAPSTPRNAPVTSGIFSQQILFPSTVLNYCIFVFSKVSRPKMDNHPDSHHPTPVSQPRSPIISILLSSGRRIGHPTACAIPCTSLCRRCPLHSSSSSSSSLPKSSSSDPAPSPPSQSSAASGSP